MSDERKRLLSAEFIKSAVAQIEEKVELGIKGFEDGEVGKAVEEKLGGLVVSGGVASNMFLRSRYVSDSTSDVVCCLTSPVRSVADFARSSISLGTIKCA